MALKRAVDVFRLVDAEANLQMVAIFIAVCQRDGITMKELTTDLEISQSSLSRNVQALNDKPRRGKSGLGLVRTDEDPNDWRRKIVILTARGRQLRAQLSEAIG
ncbi:DNA-binding transcriptional regulator, MarR family [Tistlia consotensis]|uniref:DNA-binding transcriptional regulator, MarR family n=2 Tax=Tistlia TaxID=1321364 RepID=A0A1Y6C869_9PROT|nr:MarR family winged helix-turn-helix transcriptional regulator [Tistlia consotensis]SMF41917.1 DNA-binding transcriptional regulator, MarR family [Tistlia consotensis USBA 355]SNR73214.1 DNA-binding transcriptional regulator, MarR family [Tistlia consotensis]